MSRVFARCLLLACCLAMVAAPGFALAREYAFPPAGSESVRSSSGTGGTERRDGESTPAFSMVHPNGIRYEANWRGRMDTDASSLLRIPGYRSPEARINAWREKARAELIDASIALADPDMPTGDDDFPVEEYLYDRGPLLSVVMTLDGLYRTAVFDLTDGRQLALSDLFRDGFNYIDHINRYLAASTLQEGRGGLLDQDFWTYSTLETHQIGPFTGLANDYPFFALNENCVQLYLPYYNPFFQLYAPGVADLEILVPLSHTISPFAGCLDASDYTSHEMPEGWHLPLVALTIDHGAFPDAQAAINANIAQGLAEAIRLADSPASWQGYEIQPYLWGHGEYLSVLYPVLDWLESTSPSCRMLWSGTYHRHTGEALNFAPLVAQLAARADAVFYRENVPGDQETFEECEDTPDLEGAVFLEAFLADWHRNLALRLRQPSGHEVRLVLPEESLAEVLPLALTIAPPGGD